jgi:hypothetical protein
MSLRDWEGLEQTEAIGSPYLSAVSSKSRAYAIVSFQGLAMMSSGLHEQ